MIRLVVFVIALFASFFSLESNADSANYGVYTNVEAIDGEPSGFEIYLINAGRVGRCDNSVLFQMFEGWPQEPELLDCCGCSSGKIQFVSSRLGLFRGTAKDGVLVGEFVDSKIRVKLSKGLGIWQK